MLKFLVIIFSTLLNKCAVQGNTGCRSYGIRNSNESYEGSSSTWLGEDGYEGYLEICISMQWRPVCGGEDWTNRVAMVACNQLGYPNTTAIAITGLCSTPPAEISDSVEVSCSSTQTRVEDCSSSVITNCNKWGGVICTSLAFCSEQICSNTSYCHPSSTCTNCSIPSELNCICYAECQTPCSNGGSCSYNNTCQCTPNWTGPDCSQSLLSMTTGSTMTSENSTVTVNTCHVNCLNGGSCSTNGSCTCPPDYSGPICEVKKDTNNSILYLIIYILAALLLLTLLITVGTVLTLILRKLSKKKGKKELRPSFENPSSTILQEETMALQSPTNKTSQSPPSEIPQNSSSTALHSPSHRTLQQNDEFCSTSHLYDRPDELGIKHSSRTCPKKTFEDSTIGFYDLVGPPDCTRDEVVNPTDLQLEEYSKLNYDLKAGQKEHTLERVSKESQPHLTMKGNNSQLDHDILSGTTSASGGSHHYPDQTYSVLDTNQLRNGDFQNGKVGPANLNSKTESGGKTNYQEEHQISLENKEKSYSDNFHENFADLGIAEAIPSYDETKLFENTIATKLNNNENQNIVAEDRITPMHKNKDSVKKLTNCLKSDQPPEASSTTTTLNYDSCTLNFNPQYISSQDIQS